MTRARKDKETKNGCDVQADYKFPLVPHQQL